MPLWYVLLNLNMHIHNIHFSFSSPGMITETVRGVEGDRASKLRKTWIEIKEIFYNVERPLSRSMPPVRLKTPQYLEERDWLSY